ncbi:hypothetical protein [Ideonella oryzae]|uniref:Uncharacterized protein n=1 Tax=Ideonella oryzae TaxID=2937441 RepID=A0ABT1BP67_9BURK|nr:hypothetical protein [Ideonella oryzae]MCO5978001.1 hypothetical protein [Ideonella oryzae]
MEIQLPALPQAPDDEAEPIWQALLQRVGQSREVSNLLERARRDFCAAMRDLHGDAIQDLRLRAGYTVSLRELWHLRTELYQLIAFHLDQAEADRRLVPVNRHFPARAMGHATTSEHHAHSSLFL